MTEPKKYTLAFLAGLILAAVPLWRELRLSRRHYEKRLHDCAEALGAMASGQGNAEMTTQPRRHG